MIFYYEAPVIPLNIFCKRKAKKELTTKQTPIMFLHSFLVTYASKDVTVREKLQEVSKKPLFLQCLQVSLEYKIQTIAQVGSKVWGLLKLYISAMYHNEKKHLCFIILCWRARSVVQGSGTFGTPLQLVSEQRESWPSQRVCIITGRGADHSNEGLNSENGNKYLTVRMASCFLADN